MKLRLSGNSIRLRLSPKDVHTLRAHGQVAQVTEFGSHSAIGYRLEAIAELPETIATCEGGHIVVQLSKSAMEHWTSTDLVSISHQQELPAGGRLKILIEKDFECLHGEENEPGETFFPNPNDTRCEPV